jgi:hypothetical protein
MHRQMKCPSRKLGPATKQLTRNKALMAALGFLGFFSSASCLGFPCVSNHLITPSGLDKCNSLLLLLLHGQSRRLQALKFRDVLLANKQTE